MKRFGGLQCLEELHEAWRIAEGLEHCRRPEGLHWLERSHQAWRFVRGFKHFRRIAGGLEDYVRVRGRTGLVLAVILTNCTILALQQPLLNPNEGRNLIIKISEPYFAVFYGVEMLVKVRT